jgi:hypothetical protein
MVSRAGVLNGFQLKKKTDGGLFLFAVKMLRAIFFVLFSMNKGLG